MSLLRSRLISRVSVISRFSRFSSETAQKPAVKLTEKPMPKSVKKRSVKWSKVKPDLNLGGTYYEMFDLDIDFQKPELSKARLRLLKDNHPDKGGSSTAFETIEKGFKILSDEKLRDEYDSKVLYAFYDGGSNTSVHKKWVKVGVTACGLMIFVPFFIIYPMYWLTRPTYIEDDSTLNRMGYTNKN